MVYFIESGQGGPVKIGYTATNRSIAARVRSLQGGNPEQLYVVATVLDAGPRTEKRVHRRLAASRLRGEWFRRTDEVDALVDYLDAGGDLYAWLREDAVKVPSPLAEAVNGTRAGRKARKRARLQQQVESGELIIRRLDESAS